jgi:flagellar biosynthesis/type III secretory pathway M-ring protein FliF/YscJ
VPALLSSLASSTAPFLRLVDESPEPEEVKAGWTAFVVFLLLILAVVVLAFSLVKQLRKAQAAKDAGVYGDKPAAGAPDEPTDRAPGEPTGESAGEPTGDVDDRVGRDDNDDPA